MYAEDSGLFVSGLGYFLLSGVPLLTLSVFWIPSALSVAEEEACSMGALFSSTKLHTPVPRNLLTDGSTAYLTRSMELFMDQ
jgi:hypothetical protein